MKKLFVLFAFAICLAGAFAQNLPEEQQSFCYPSLLETKITEVRNDLLNAQLIEMWAQQKPRALQVMAANSIYTFEGLAMSLRADCNCFGKEKVFGNWNDIMCLQDGKMLQERLAEEPIKPFCTEVFAFKEQQEVVNELCKTCPPPIFVGDWKEVGCVQGFPLMSKQMQGYKFNTSVNQCVPVQQALLQVQKSRGCNVATYVMTFYGGIYLIAAIGITIGLVYWYFRRK